MEAFLNADAEKIIALSSGDLQEISDKQELKNAIVKIKQIDELQDKYAIQKLQGMHMWLDEWNFKNQYDLHEIFISRYLINGRKNIIVKINLFPDSQSLFDL